MGLWRRRIFRLLLGHVGQRSVKLEDMEALLIGVPPEKRAAVWAGSLDQAESIAATAAVRIPSIASRVISGRAHVEKISQLHHEADFIIKTLSEFKKMLIVKYGSVFSGWKRLLDYDANGIVTQSNFSDACQVLG